MQILWSCGEKPTEGTSPQIFDLVILDSIEVKEIHGFFSRPSSVHLINDTLIGIESFQNKGIWVIDNRTGQEVYSILPEEENGLSFRPTKCYWAEYPEISVFDGATKRIHNFDLNNEKGKRHINSLILNTPDDLWFKPILMGIFIKKDENYYIEHSTNKVPFTSNKYFELTNHLIGIYSSEGEHLKNYIPFPDELRNLTKFIGPGKLFTSGLSNDGDIYISFPFTKTISIFDSSNLDKPAQLIRYPDSPIFQFDIPFLETEVDNTIGALKYYSEAHYFNDFKFDQDGFVLQSIMKGEENTLTHFLKYDRIDEKWSESSSTFNLLNLGELAGIKNDTLIFVDASMINKDKKFIKRAVLRPIEE